MSESYKNTPGVAGITQDELDHFGIEAATGQLYWREKPVFTETRFGLKTFEKALAIAVSLSAIISTILIVVSYFRPPGK